MNKTSFAIGCLVQWYEVEIIEEYIESLKDAIKQYEGKVIVDFVICNNQNLEKAITPKLLDDYTTRIKLACSSYNVKVTDKLVTIADYRREFNQKYCTKADVLIWGESDMLLPQQAFIILNHLHQNVKTPKYLATFAICKMWDESWKPLEHVDFTDKPFIEMDTENWWSLRYTMSKEEMDTINARATDLAVTTVSPHKYNGCGLIISSEVIKSGVNIPSSVFFVHEDTAFMFMSQKVLGNIPQYHFSNILVVHNRKHAKKRSGIKGEENIDKTITGHLRSVHSWYNKANQMCEKNAYNLFNPNYKSFTWNDVWNS